MHDRCQHQASSGSPRLPRCSPRDRTASGRPPSNGVATPTTAFIGGFRFLGKQLDEQVAKLHIRALREREFTAVDSPHLKALDFKRNYGPCRAVRWHNLVSRDFRRALRCLPDVMSEIDIFVSSTGNYQLQRIGPHEEVEERFARWKHRTL